MNWWCCPAGFLRECPGQPAVTERIRLSADGFVWLALSVRGPVCHHESQTHKSFQKTAQIFRFYHSQQLKTDWRQWQLPRGQTCDRQSIFVQEGSFHSTHWGDYCVAAFIILTGFLQIQGFATFDMKCWQPVLQADWGFLSDWMGSMSVQHDLYTYVCKIRYSSNWNWKIYHLYAALSFPVFEFQNIFSSG